MKQKEMLLALKIFIVKNYIWIILALFTLFFIWINPILFLDYIRVIKWPLIILVLIGFFKKEISILTTEKLNSFFVKAFGIELQGNLAEQSKERKGVNETENLPNNMIQEKIKELSETKEELSIAVETLHRNLAIKEIELDFERIYNRIFGSQFSFLENLLVSGGILKIDLVVSWYSNIQNQYPLFKEWSVSQYLAFLQNNQLIEFDNINSVFKISEKGKVFVKYIRIDMMYAGYKPL